MELAYIQSCNTNALSTVDVADLPPARTTGVQVVYYYYY
jgi:hypothetical protein